MSKNRGAFKAGSFVLVLVTLAGCYSTEMPVIGKGEKAPLAGEHACENAMTGEMETWSYTEQKSGAFRPDFTYIDGDGVETKLVEMAEGLRLVQAKSQSGNFNYGYIDFIDDDRFILSVADMMSKGPYIEALAESSGVMFGSGAEPGEIALDGNEGDILAFLLAHDKSMLSAYLSCTRQ